MLLSVTPSRSCSLLKMLLARTTAYCRYGPVSPSKLSASSMSKTISLPRENFSMKYADRADGDLRPRRAGARPSVSSGLRLATSADAFAISRSSRSSIFTPRPFRPETSTNGFFASSSSGGRIAELARGACDSATISYEKCTEFSASFTWPSVRSAWLSSACRYIWRESMTL